jgi:pyruvate/2-oxoglutarate/acetoin dehydrogenase E1 component
MPEMTFTEGDHRRVREEMRRDPLVFAIGEDAWRSGRGLRAVQGTPRRSLGWDGCWTRDLRDVDRRGGGGRAGALRGGAAVVDMHFADFIATAMDRW